MTKVGTQIAVPRGDIQANRPEFLAPLTQAPAGLDLVNQYISPPRLKVVQKSTRSPIIDVYNVGDVIAMPMQQLVAAIILNDAKRPTKDGTPFYFTPVLFYPEWLFWNPLETQGVLPAIRERSFDPTSELAIKSRSPETWSVKCPEMPEKDGKPIFCRYVEHLNFVVVIEPPNIIEGIPVVMSFARGEHKSGSSFCALLKMRHADIFGCRFEGVVHWRPGTGKGDWMGIDVVNPSDDKPWVETPELYDAFGKLHSEMLDAWKKKILVVDHEDEIEEQPVDSPAKF